MKWNDQQEVRGTLTRSSLLGWTFDIWDLKPSSLHQLPDQRARESGTNNSTSAGTVNKRNEESARSDRTSNSNHNLKG